MDKHESDDHKGIPSIMPDLCLFFHVMQHAIRPSKVQELEMT